jgi:hypothetical protein
MSWEESTICEEEHSTRGKSQVYEPGSSYLWYLLAGIEVIVVFVAPDPEPGDSFALKFPYSSVASPYTH